MKEQRLLGFACAAALLLAGCGSASDKDARDAATSRDAETTADSWNAADACALLDKATLGTALGDEVTETSLGLVHQSSGADAATSECTYMLKSGGRASLMARKSPIADNSEGAMAAARKATEESLAAFTDKKVEDVPGLGRSAFFVPGINQLNAFIDDDKFVIVTIGSAPGATAKATAADLVRKIKS